MTRKDRIICCAWGLALLVLVGAGWSLTERPTAGGAVLMAALYVAVFVGALYVNKVLQK